MDGARSFFESPRAFWYTFGVGLLAVQVPVWIAPWLPMQDLGGHIELMDIVVRYDDPATLYREVFEEPQLWGANTLTLLAARLCGAITGVALLAKLYFAAFALAFPLSVLLMAREFSRSPWLAFAGLPLVYGGMTCVGLINYLIALPMLFGCVVLAKRHGDGTTRWAGLALGLGLTLIFFAHALTLFFALGCVGLVLALRLRAPKDVLRFSWPLLFPVPFVVPWLREITQTLEAGAAEDDVSAAPLGARWPELQHIDDLFREGALEYFHGRADDIALYALILAWAVVVAGALLSLRRRGREPGARSGRERILDATPWFLAAACTVAFLVLPAHFDDISIISGRIPILILMFAAVAPRADVARRVDRIGLAALVVFGLTYPAFIAYRFNVWARDSLGGLEEMIEALDDRSRLGWLIVDPLDEYIDGGVHWHQGQGMHAVHNGGIFIDSFAKRGYTPVQYRPYMEPQLVTGDFYTEVSALTQFDYVLVRAFDEPTPLVTDPWFRLRDRTHGYWLYDVVAQVDGRRVYLTGGRGGTSTTATCPGGSRLSGVDLRHDGNWLTWIGPTCTPSPPRIAPWVAIPGTENPPDELSCSGEEHLVGLFGQSGARVDSVGIVCAMRGWSGADDLHRSETIGRVAGGEYHLLCPPGEVVRDLAGSRDDAVISVGITCGVPGT